MRGPIAIRLAAGSIPEPNTGCILWTKGATAQGRYGAIRAGNKVLMAHRAAWEVANGRPVPDGMCVCHKCDVTMCVNPDHLFLGTHDDNMDDKAQKRRAPLKYDDAMVQRIREMAVSGLSHSEISRRTGIPRPTISPICRGETRRHV